jgi:hypothetical protein
MHFAEQVVLAKQVILFAIQANFGRIFIEAPCSKLQGIFDGKELAILWGSLANPAVRQRRTGNALALLNFPKGTLFHRARWFSSPEESHENLSLPAVLLFDFLRGTYVGRLIE